MSNPLSVVVPTGREENLEGTAATTSMLEPRARMGAGSAYFAWFSGGIYDGVTEGKGPSISPVLSALPNFASAFGEMAGYAGVAVASLIDEIANQKC